MSDLTREKLNQAAAIVAQSDVDVWLTFVRETSALSDPCLPFLMEGGLTWQSALLVSKSEKKVAVVGNFDTDGLQKSGDWDELIGYVQSIREPLLDALEELIPVSVAAPQIAVNYSENDDKCDGLTYGMFRLLESYLAHTRFTNALASAEPIIRALRGRKTASELAAMRGAIAETDTLFAEVAAFATVGRTERQIGAFVHGKIHERGLGFAWEAEGNPMVNCGPYSAVGHGTPGELALEAGHILHLDLGVVQNGYASDLQRCWFVGSEIPEAVSRAHAAVLGAIEAGFAALKPGVSGWEVDAAARSFLVAAGYPEYLHALGHQVGRVAHDGGGILGPCWARYGQTPYWAIEVGQVYTLELGVRVEGYGYWSLEEMVVVTEGGAEWLSTPQRDIWTL
ncbi:M24 family metallopeptidase [Armatimonas sp.]|uniref:M24 family metallopeptidase n=1 Tax=Armatimonas sp. TaxID=1872638 RepID=UPI00374CDE30